MAPFWEQEGVYKYTSLSILMHVRGCWSRISELKLASWLCRIWKIPKVPEPSDSKTWMTPLGRIFVAPLRFSSLVRLCHLVRSSQWNTKQRGIVEQKCLWRKMRSISKGGEFSTEQCVDSLPAWQRSTNYSALRNNCNTSLVPWLFIFHFC